MHGLMNIKFFALVQCHRAFISTIVAVGLYASWHSVQILTRPPIRPIQTSFRNFSTLYPRKYLCISNTSGRIFTNTFTRVFVILVSFPGHSTPLFCVCVFVILLYSKLFLTTYPCPRDSSAIKFHFITS
jgi:hypothetical protein